MPVPNVGLAGELCPALSGAAQNGDKHFAALEKGSGAKSFRTRYVDKKLWKRVGVLRGRHFSLEGTGLHVVSVDTFLASATVSDGNRPISTGMLAEVV